MDANSRDLIVRSIRIAEWILGLATSRDRAVSMAGDLMEEAAPRGLAWFWTGVLRIMASLLWSGVAENPMRIAGVAFVGLAVDVVASMLLAGLTGVVFFLESWSGHQIQLNPVWFTLAFKASALVISVLIGRMLARLAPGHELCACLAYAILGSLLSVTLMFISARGLGLSVLLGMFLSEVAQQTPVLVGAVWGRYRGLAAG
jgi:hypothetical protein